MKVNRIIVSLVLIFALVLTGCGNGKKEIADQISLPDGAESLSNSELRKLKNWFNDDFFRIRFMNSTYDSPKSIDMYSLFYFGNGNKIEMSTDEIEAFLGQFGWWSDFDTYMITGKEIDDVLLKYCNISFDDTDKVHLGSLYYVKENDSYYSMSSSTDESEFEPIYGYKYNDNIYLFYINSIKVNTAMDGYFRVTLKNDGEDYYFVANEFCDFSAGNVEYITDIYKEEENNESYLIEETIEIQSMTEREDLRGLSLDTSVANIKLQDGFEEVEISGHSYTDISEYGTIVAGKINGQVMLYYVEKDGDVFTLPMPYAFATPAEMLFGGGDIVFEYMMQSASLLTDDYGMPLEFTSWYCTLFLPTNEVYVRTVYSSLAEN